MNVVACRSCGNGMIWTTTTKGKPMPVDWKATPNGSFRLRRIPDEPTPIAEYVPPAERFSDVQLHDSHFATCPKADLFRKKKVAAMRGR